MYDKMLSLVQGQVFSHKFDAFLFFIPVYTMCDISFLLMAEFAGASTARD